MERSLARSIVAGVASHELENSHLWLGLELKQIIRRLARNILAQHNERRNVAPIHPLNSPVDDLLRRVKSDIGTLLDIAFPIHK